MSIVAFWGSLILTSGALALGYAFSQDWPMAALALLAGGGWALAQRRGQAQIAAPMLVGHIALAALGRWFGANGALMLLGVTGALAAWDLQRLCERLAYAPSAQAARDLERVHLARLGLVSALGYLAGLAALIIQVRLHLALLLLLGLFAISGLSYGVRYIRRAGG
jgi:hypothetical protein